MVYKSGPIFLPFCQGSRVWQTDRQTEFSSLDRVCISCSAVITVYTTRQRIKGFTFMRHINLHWQLTLTLTLTMNEWKWIGFKCVRKRTNSRLSTIHGANKSSRFLVQKVSEMFQHEIDIAKINVQSGTEKIAQSLMHRYFATVCSRITQYSPTCSEINWQHETRANFEYCD